MKIAIYETGSGASNSSFPPITQKNQSCWILTVDDLSFPTSRNMTVNSGSISHLLWFFITAVQANGGGAIQRDAGVTHAAAHLESQLLGRLWQDAHLNIGVGQTWTTDRMRKSDLTYNSEGVC